MDNEQTLLVCEEERERDKTDIEDDLNIPRQILKSPHNTSFYRTDHEVLKKRIYSKREREAIHSFGEVIKTATDMLQKAIKTKLVIYQRSDIYGNIETTITKAPKEIKLVPGNIEVYAKK